MFSLFFVLGAFLAGAGCQYCKEVDGPLHFLNCIQAKNLGSFIRETLSPLFFTQEEFSWTKVRTLDLSSSSHEERLAGLIFLSETVNHISVTRKNAQNASPVKLAAIISHRADVTAKASPAAGAALVHNCTIFLSSLDVRNIVQGGDPLYAGFFSTQGSGGYT